MKNIVCLFYSLLFVLPSSICLAQSEADSTKFSPRFALYTDLILNLLNEKNIGVEVKVSPRFAFGASFGRIRWLEMNGEIFNSDIFIANHDLDPGRVYSGSAYKINTKFYPPKTGNSYYIQAGLLYKYLHYDTAYFHDGARASDTRSFRRSNEQAYLFGTDLITGIELIIGKLFVVDCFGGFGYRFKNRSYTTYYSTGVNGSAYPKVQLGDFNVNHNYLAFILGLKMGFCYTKRQYKPSKN